MSNAGERIAVERAERPLFVGVDVGGTNTKIGLVDNLGRTAAACSIPTLEETGPEDAVSRIRGAIVDLLAEIGLDLAAVTGVGLGTPGS